MIENERHPSWVSFVAIFLPVAQHFRCNRQPDRKNPACPLDRRDFFVYFYIENVCAFNF